MTELLDLHLHKLLAVQLLRYRSHFVVAHLVEKAAVVARRVLVHLRLLIQWLQILIGENLLGLWVAEKTRRSCLGSASPFLLEGIGSLPMQLIEV